MPQFGQKSSPRQTTEPVQYEAAVRLGNPEVYKYRLLPQSSVGPNTAFVTKRNSPQSSENAMLQRTHDKFFYHDSPSSSWY